MALAILKYLESANGQHIFEADIGTNSYYQFRIGKEHTKIRGLDVVDGIAHQSGMIKPPTIDPSGFNTRFRLQVPANLFNRNARYIQLTSFKTPGQRAPALSDVVAVLPALVDIHDDYKLPKIMALSETHEQKASEIATESAPCRIKENKVSEAMFFQAILGALPALLAKAAPIAAKVGPALLNALPIVEQIVGSAGKIVPEISKMIPGISNGTNGHSNGGAAASGGSVAAPTTQVTEQISPETLKAILEVIQSINSRNGQQANNSGASGNGQARAQSMKHFSHDFSINPETLMKLAPLLEKVISPETIKAIGDNPVKLFKAVSDSALKFQKMELDHLEKLNPGVSDTSLDNMVKGMGIRRPRRRQRYSEAKVAPALLAALPALMPVLEKVLNPETIKAIGDQPVKLFNAIAEAGLKHTQQELEHLERINPGVDDPAFDAIVNSMSVKSAVSIDAIFSEDYTIEFVNAQTVSVVGKDKVVYDRRQQVRIPIKLTAKSEKAEKQLAKGIFQLIIQDGDTMDVLLEKKYKLKEIAVGVPVQEIVLDTIDTKKLPLNRDLKLELSFNWRKGNKIKGTFKNHYVSFCNGYLYQRAGGNISQRFALNDVNRFRNYWHKVWEGGPTTHERWKIDFECKYYYTVNLENANIKKLETKKKTVTDSATEKSGDDYRRSISAKLKTGMEISLAAYNELLKLHDLPALDIDQLSAFMGQDFTKEASTAARVGVDFRGRKGETSALWVYPEGIIQSYILSKSLQADATGMITQLQEEEVQFPKFSSVHFIGTKTN